MPTTLAARETQIWEWLSAISDPEVPVLSIIDLGIVRGVEVSENGEVIVRITPTYSGCPAMDVISMQIRMALISRGVRSLKIEQQLSPAWTTDWMTEEGKKKLHTYGIAPPQYSSNRAKGLFEEDEVPCPRCLSANTKVLSDFGSTSCKAQYQCLDCKEPFEHFKCH